MILEHHLSLKCNKFIIFKEFISNSKIYIWSPNSLVFDNQLLWCLTINVFMSIDRIPSFYIQHQLKLVINILSVLQIVVMVIHIMFCESHFTYNLNDDIESCLMMTSLEQNGGYYLVSIQLIYSFKKLFFL